MPTHLNCVTLMPLTTLRLLAVLTSSRGPPLLTLLTTLVGGTSG